MEPLYMIQIQPEQMPLLRFLYSQGLLAGPEERHQPSEDDLGYGLHAWMRAAFGTFAPQPWRAFFRPRQRMQILGYSHHPAEELQRYLREFAEPMAAAVCGPEWVADRRMPDWTPGRRLGFEVLCCPVGRKAGSGIEKDLFLIRADASPERTLRREAVYCDWARERLEREGAARVESVRLAGFRRVRQMRRGTGRSGSRELRAIERPQALIRGTLRVDDPEAFSALLARGVGRHKAFGYGMVLVRPPL